MAYSSQLTRRKKPKRRFAPLPRPIGRVRGRGGYYADLGTLGGAAAGGLAGGMMTGGVGAFPGAAFGATLGGSAGGVIDHISGRGAYEVRANSLLGRIPEGTNIPSFGDMAGGTIIRHREFIRDITAVGATAFTNISLPLNPGLASTFPWLASISGNYESYQIMGMIFEFRSTSSDSVTTSGGPLGTVIMSTDYDAVDSAYVSKLQMENSQYAVSNKPSLNQVHIIECDSGVTSIPIKYVRTGAVPSGKDARFYDHGIFQLATSGLAASTGTIGELWVSYEIALYKPTVSGVVVYGGVSDHFDISTSATTAHYLGADTTTVYDPVAGSNINGTVMNSTYTFPVSYNTGTYQITYVMTGGAGTQTNAFAATLVNATAATGLVGAVAQATNTATSTNNTTVMFTQFITLVASSQSSTWTISAGTGLGAITAVDLWVVAVNGAITT